MSYDLTIKSDASHSQRADKESLAKFIARIPRVESNGSDGFVLTAEPNLRMEIDLEVVDQHGDSTDSPHEGHTSVNCVRFHIPYGFLDDASMKSAYLPCAVSIAKHLGWKLYDDQQARPDSPIYPDESKSWFVRYGIPLIALFVAVRVVLWMLRHRSQ